MPSTCCICFLKYEIVCVVFQPAQNNVVNPTETPLGSDFEMSGKRDHGFDMPGRQSTVLLIHISDSGTDKLTQSIFKVSQLFVLFKTPNDKALDDADVSGHLNTDALQQLV